ncbi:MAG TPA: hypothetical protein VJP79_03080 [Nitrososphaera sp.]|nr:hypothetical protein [Nitrososphaera sp.]
MDYFRQGSASSLTYKSHRLFLPGSILLSVGVMLAAGGGSWDITNHLLNKPETFFAPPHAVLYSGVGTSVAGALLVFFASRSMTGRIVWPAKLALAGIALLVSAGPVDFAWHSAYGLDGLFSPPHFVLVSGMVASSLGGLASMVYYKSMSLRTRSGGSRVLERINMHPALIVIGIVPLWLSLSGVVDMLTLPFSDTPFFKFNPDPASGVAIATMAFPIVIASCLCGASVLSGRRFGAMSLAGAAFLTTSALTSIVPSEALHPTLLFYALSIIPIVAADAIMSYRFWRPFAIPVYAAGAVLGLTFIALYYPLVTHTFNEAINPARIVWPSVTAEIYFDMITPATYAVMAVPSAALGVAGAIAANRIVGSRNMIM